MPLTLNQILARFRTLGLAHKQIRSFYFGSPPEHDIQGGAGDVTYPALFVEKLPGSTSRANHQHRYNFRLYFYDLVKVAEGSEQNETEVLSDMDSVALDFMAMLMSATYQDDWVIVDDVAEESREEQLGDMVGGSVREVGILIDFLADGCQVPQSEVVFDDQDIPIPTGGTGQRILTYDGTGSEGSSFIIPGLAGKRVVAVYRAGFYKRAILTTPDDTEEIKVVGTGLGSYMGILSTTGGVELMAGDALIPGEKLDFIIY